MLDRSRLKRLARERGCELKSVTKTLNYPSLIEGQVCTSEGPSIQSPGLVPVEVEISEEGRKEASNTDHIKDSECHMTVSRFRLFCHCLWKTYIRTSYSPLTSTTVDIYSVLVSMSLSIM